MPQDLRSLKTRQERGQDRRHSGRFKHKVSRHPRYVPY
jgi:hypothetical protein